MEVRIFVDQNGRGAFAKGKIVQDESTSFDKCFMDENGEIPYDGINGQAMLYLAKHLGIEIPPMCVLKFKFEGMVDIANQD